MKFHTDIHDPQTMTFLLVPPCDVRVIGQIVAILVINFSSNRQNFDLSSTLVY